MEESVCEHLFLWQWSSWLHGELLGNGGVISLRCRKDPNGRSGLQYVLELVLHLLDPLLPEFSASYVGKLVIVFIQKVPIRNCSHPL